LRDDGRQRTSGCCYRLLSRRDHELRARWHHPDLDPGAERIFGYTAEEAVGQSVMLLMPDDRADEAGRGFEQVARGEIVRFEAPRRRKDGSLFEAAVTLAPMKAGNGWFVSDLP